MKTKYLILYSILGTDGEYFPACPVAGEYTGKLTDNPELCAKLYSDCNKLDIMYFLVTPCHNSTQVIEGKTIQIFSDLNKKFLSFQNVLINVWVNGKKTDSYWLTS